MTCVKDVLIVGGGTSGWLTAAYLAKKLGSDRPGGVRITLIESSEIGTVGVGEATVPPIRTIIAALGLDEAEFMREVSATFKLAIKFNDWLNLPDDTAKTRHSYYHTFGPFGRLGSPLSPELNAPYWVLDRKNTELNFVDYTMTEGRICNIGRGPKRITDEPYSGILEYAYHFDAGRLAQLLKKVGKGAGVTHLIGTVTNVELSEDGSIGSVETKEHGSLTADLYVDCTGFAAHLIEKALGREFYSLTDTLFCDRAVACQAPYEDVNCSIPPYTTATAQENGWTWDIPLNNRRGVGYVYSSQYSDQGRAEEVLVNYLDQDTSDLKIWHLKIRVGSRRQQWYKNCISIGLSAGFIEPLESTGIYLCDIAIRWLTEFMPPIEQMDLAAAQFNRRMNDTYADIVDFIKLHYALSRRTDTDFWIDNQRPETMTETLRNKLEYWKYRVPGIHEFTGLPNVFGLTNHMQVMYGMEYVPDLSGQESRFLNLDLARKLTKKYESAARGGAQALPDHRQLIDAIYTQGFQPQPRRQRAGQFFV